MGPGPVAAVGTGDKCRMAVPPGPREPGRGGAPSGGGGTLRRKQLCSAPRGDCEKAFQGPSGLLRAPQQGDPHQRTGFSSQGATTGSWKPHRRLPSFSFNALPCAYENGACCLGDDGTQLTAPSGRVSSA